MVQLAVVLVLVMLAKDEGTRDHDGIASAEVSVCTLSPVPRAGRRSTSQAVESRAKEA